jgi:hypothetical protein
MGFEPGLLAKRGSRRNATARFRGGARWLSAKAEFQRL